MELASDLRTDAENLTEAAIASWIVRASDRLDPYWRSFFLVLLTHLAQIQGLASPKRRLQELVFAAFQAHLLVQESGI